MRGRILLALEVYTEPPGGGSGVSGLPGDCPISSLVDTYGTAGDYLGNRGDMQRVCSEYAGESTDRTRNGSDPVRSGLRPVWTGLTILGSSIGGGPL